MRLSIILKNKISFVSVMLALVLGLGMLTTTVNAQKDLLAASADLDLCRNGTLASPVACTGSAWVNGNANSTQAHWAESQFLAYRVKFTDLPIGAHSFTIGYDILASSKHAIDYLGTFNATETTADPCSGVAGCTLGSPTSTFAVPVDTVTVTNNTNPNTGNPIVQTPGQFTMWGGTITGVSYEPYGGGDERKITITFTASVANPVLAWGGHIAWIGDWGVSNSANSIPGSPFHMRNDNLDGSGGNQDRALQAAAVIPSGAVFVKKVAVPLDGSGNAVLPFAFTATANFGPTSFSLIDDNAGPGIDTQQSQAIISFGAGNTITVTEGMGPVGWTLSNVNCVESGIANSTQNTIGPAAIIVELGEVVTCTFTNTQLVPSAATVTVAGRVVTSGGMGIMRARVIMTDSEGNARSAVTNSFGYYHFDDVEIGQTLVFNVFSKQYQFSPRIVSLTDSIADLDFTAF
ncbi:MAG: carboxypeptidase-like regulatory domain-containing protein [Pyrinomonadaceae bacterium]